MTLASMPHDGRQQDVRFGHAGLAITWRMRRRWPPGPLRSDRGGRIYGSADQHALCTAQASFGRARVDHDRIIDRDDDAASWRTPMNHEATWASSLKRCAIISLRGKIRMPSAFARTGEMAIDSGRKIRGSDGQGRGNAATCGSTPTNSRTTGRRRFRPEARLCQGRHDPRRQCFVHFRWRGSVGDDAGRRRGETGPPPSLAGGGDRRPRA